MKRSLTLGAAFGGMAITAGGCIYLASGWDDMGWIGRTVGVALGFGVLLMALLVSDRRPSRQRLRVFGIGGLAFCSIGGLVIVYSVWRDGGWAIVIPVVVLAIGGEQILTQRSRRRRRTGG